jgi:hypothetical protein
MSLPWPGQAFFMGHGEGDILESPGMRRKTSMVMI